LETLKILITDDEPGMRMAVERSLRGFKVSLPDVEGEVSFTVEQAATGEEALEKIKLSAPDILLLDYKLPGISGLEVLEQIAPRQADMLTIMITAYASLETAVTATKRGAYDFLAKPFTPEELKNTIRKAASRLILTKQARKLADEKRKVRFQFISVLAHELKSPLAAIEGYLQIVRSHANGEDLPAYDPIIDRSMIRLDGMRKLIIDLLDMTRIESGEKQRDLAEVDVASLALRVVDSNLPEAQKRNISITLDVESPLNMVADSGEIEIILNNLISNAVKYNRDNGRVEVGICDQGEKIVITVSDTGIGMTEDEAGKLFNDFVRIKNEKTRSILGSGLGLSIVKKLAQLYGGTATVTSAPDVGSTFTVILNNTPLT
jgi:two-component system, sensor histidine kinase and response regulator